MLHSCDLYLDPMTLIYEFDLKILKMYICVPKMKVVGQSFQKIEHYTETDRQM